MANSLEFSLSGHPIENRYDGYGDDIASGYEGRYGDPQFGPTCFDTWTRPEPRTVLASEIDDYDPFGDMEAWGKAYGCLDDDQDEDAGE